MDQSQPPKTTKKFSTTTKIFIVVIFAIPFGLGMGYIQDKANGRAKTNDAEKSTQEIGSTSKAGSSSTINQENDVCKKCNGRGKIATYSAYGCSDMSHFSLTDCGIDHHGPACIPSGAKTCTCCKGSGKNK